MAKKIERKLLAHFIEVPGASVVCTRLGEGIEEMQVSMGANVVKKTDITGVTDVSIDKYETTQEVTPYMAREGDPLFNWLQSIIDERKTLDDLNTNVVDVKLWEAQVNGKYPATREKCVVEVTSYGGNTEGYQIPFNVHRTGERESGMFDMVSKTFVPDIPVVTIGAVE